MTQPPETTVTTGGAGEGHELVISGLRAGVSGREVIKGVDLVVRSGEVHAVMGPNGSGKSTLSHVIMGKPGYVVLGGSVTLDGTDVLALAPWERARLGLFLAPQYPVEVPGVGVSRALAEALSEPGPSDGGAVQGDPEHAGALLRSVEERTSSEAEKLGLPKALLERSLNVDLSGGERKRSETIQLAVLRPHFAVLDELDSGLDVDGLRSVARRVRAGVGEWGLGVLAITHYRRLLTELVPDSVHVLVGGRIVAQGGPELADELDRQGYKPYEEQHVS